METRQTIEYKIYVLNLSDMHGGVDKSIGIAVFDDIEKLKSYYNAQLASAPYTDEASADSYGNVHSWNKVFKKGSPLEWFNPMYNFDIVSYQDAGFGGITEYWMQNYPSQEKLRVPFNPLI